MDSLLHKSIILFSRAVTLLPEISQHIVNILPFSLFIAHQDTMPTIGMLV
jgi:hypothetical protein